MNTRNEYSNGWRENFTLLNSSRDRYTPSVPKIHRLDLITVTQIAAGEVIDRPASAVKELIENSLDAGATKITIAIQHGGKTLIRVTDNGGGIDPEDLPLAPLAHTTSKITTFDDIYSASTFGFRGEALASMAHVGVLEILSKTPDAGAFQIIAVNDQVTAATPTSHPNGTSILVKGLFRSLPVRQKFLKSDSTEQSYIYETVQQFALVRPDVDFVLENEEKTLISTIGVSDIAVLVEQWAGRVVRGKLLLIDETIGGVRVQGVVTDPTVTFGSRQYQVTSVNGRLIKNPILLKAIQHCFADLVPQKRFSVAILQITVLTGDVDVNVHPQKMDVKFVKPASVFEAIQKVLRSAIQGSHLAGFSVPNPARADFGFGFAATLVPQRVGYVEELPLNRWTSMPERVPQAAVSAWTSTLSALAEIPKFAVATQERPPERYPYFHVFETYLVIHAPDGVWILDQHAVHERVLYEKFKADRVLDSDGAIQPLLISEVVSLTPAEFAVWEEMRPVFAEMGIETEAFGSLEIAIRSVPMAFRTVNWAEFISNTLDSFRSGNPDLTNPIAKDAIQMKACKAAIKAGHRLKPEEVDALIDAFCTAPSNFTCPHGRPLFVKLDQVGLEKMFDRR